MEKNKQNWSAGSSSSHALRGTQREKNGSNFQFLTEKRMLCKWGLGGVTYLLNLADLLSEVVLLPGLLLLGSLQSQPQIGHLKQQADQEDRRHISVCVLDYLYIVKNNAVVSPLKCLTN